jgi:hypothetical protein
LTLSPEEQELHAKKADLAPLEGELAERELELATVKAELRVFEKAYLSVVGVKFADRDELEARVAAARARRSPGNRDQQQRAAWARQKADASANAAIAALALNASSDFRPSEKMKALYRDIAKRLHPDLAPNEKSRNRRTQLMAEANLAYAEGDEKRLRAVLGEWESSPESVPGEGVAADLIRTIRKIHQIKERLADIKAQILGLRTSDLWRLRAESEIAKARGRDLLAEMARGLDAENLKLQVLLESLFSVEASL